MKINLLKTMVQPSNNLKSIGTKSTWNRFHNNLFRLFDGMILHGWSTCNLIWLMRLRFCYTSIIETWIIFFSCDQAALQMVFSVCLSVCPSVRLSICPSHLFDYVPIIVSSWNFQELLLMTDVRSMQKVKVRGQRSRSQRSRPNFSFPDCNSSLNSHMMMKWYI